jgi:nucleoid DNA-binding protein
MHEQIRIDRRTLHAHGPHPKKAEALVNSILNSMIIAMKNKRRVEIRGFGSFVMRDYKPYIGRNPRAARRSRSSRKPCPSSSPAKT